MAFGREIANLFATVRLKGVAIAGKKLKKFGDAGERLKTAKGVE